MPRSPRVGDLEIHQDLQHQRLEWRIQRIGWLLMALIVLAALLGLLGSGPLSRVSKTASDGSLRVEYNRFLHYHDPETLRIYVAGGNGTDNQLRLWLDSEYLSNIEIQRITPEPDFTEAGPDFHLYVFRRAQPMEPTTVSIHFEADARGRIDGRLGLVGKETLSFWHFVYP